MVSSASIVCTAAHITVASDSPGPATADTVVKHHCESREASVNVGDGVTSAPATVYCPVCWGTGQLYAPAAPVDRPDSSCGSCCTSTIEGMEPYPCARCTGTGVVPRLS